MLSQFPFPIYHKFPDNSYYPWFPSLDVPYSIKMEHLGLRILTERLVFQILPHFVTQRGSWKIFIIIVMLAACYGPASRQYYGLSTLYSTIPRFKIMRESNIIISAGFDLQDTCPRTGASWITYQHCQYHYCAYWEAYFFFLSICRWCRIGTVD